MQINKIFTRIETKLRQKERKMIKKKKKLIAKKGN